MNYLCSFLVSSCVSVLNNIQRKYFIFCGFAGMITYTTYTFFLSYLNDAISSLIACIILSFFSQLSARKLNVPSSIFIIPGIMPIVPGSLLFKSFNFLIEKNYMNALENSLQTLLVGFSIALGLLINETITLIIANYKSDSMY